MGFCRYQMLRKQFGHAASDVIEKSFMIKLKGTDAGNTGLR